MIIFKNTKIIVLISLFVLNMYTKANSKEVLDPEYLKSVKYIKIDSFDTLDNYKGSKPQIYYIDLFTSILIMGINGYTNYEVLADDVIISPDLILKCKLVEMSSDSQKTDKVTMEDDDDISAGVSSYYTTYCTVQVSGYNPENGNKIFNIQKRKGTSSEVLEDELKECVINLAEGFLKHFYKMRKKGFTKSFYVNNLNCNLLKNNRVSYLFLGARSDPFLDKLLDVVEAELQQYCYNKKMNIFRLDNKPDSIIQSNAEKIDWDGESNVLNSNIIQCMQNYQTDYLVVISDLTGFKMEKLPDKMKKWSKSIFDLSTTHYITSSWGGQKISIPSHTTSTYMPRDDPLANMGEMNKYQRVFCSLYIIDIKNNQIVLRTQLFLMEGMGYDNPAIHLTRGIIAEIGEYDPSTLTVSSCYVGVNPIRRKRWKRK